MTAMREQVKARLEKDSRNKSSDHTALIKLIAGFSFTDTGDFECDRPECTSTTPCIEPGACIECEELMTGIHCHEVRIGSPITLPFNQSREFKREFIDELQNGDLLEETMAKHLLRLGIPINHPMMKDGKTLKLMFSNYPFGIIEHSVNHETEFHYNVVALPRRFSICRVQVPEIVKGEESKRKTVACSIVKCRDCQPAHDVSDHRGTSLKKEIKDGLGDMKRQVLLLKKTKMTRLSDKLDILPFLSKKEKENQPKRKKPSDDKDSGYESDPYAHDAWYDDEE